MNDHNANELCGVLSGAYCFAELDVRITEALELADCCNHIGIDLAQLAAPLDAAARAAEAEEETAQPHLKRQRSASDVGDVLPGERRAVLDVSAFDPHTASAVLTCAGRYCALVNQPGLALGHFRAALAASSTGGHSPSTFGPAGVPEPEGSSEAEAHLGMVQSALQLGLREHATSLTMSFWRGGSAGGVGSCSPAYIHLAFLLAALSEALPAPPPDALALLRRLTPLLGTAACSAVESLAARWLPSQVPTAALPPSARVPPSPPSPLTLTPATALHAPATALQAPATALHAPATALQAPAYSEPPYENVLAEPFVQAALAGSRAFGSRSLETLACAARRRLLLRLLGPLEGPLEGSLEGMAEGRGGGGAAGRRLRNASSAHDGAGCEDESQMAVNESQMAVNESQMAVMTDVMGDDLGESDDERQLFLSGSSSGARNGGRGAPCRLAAAFWAGGAVVGGGGAGGSSEDGGARLQLIEAAAAVASWASFADFCLDETPAEGAVVARACAMLEAGLSAGSAGWPVSHAHELSCLVAAAMYQDLSKVRQ